MNSGVSLLVVSPNIGDQEHVSRNVEFQIVPFVWAVPTALKYFSAANQVLASYFTFLSPFINFFSMTICEDLLKTKKKQNFNKIISSHFFVKVKQLILKIFFKNLLTLEELQELLLKKVELNSSCWYFSVEHFIVILRSAG